MLPDQKVHKNKPKAHILSVVTILLSREVYSNWILLFLKGMLESNSSSDRSNISSDADLSSMISRLQFFFVTTQILKQYLDLNFELS